MEGHLADDATQLRGVWDKVSETVDHSLDGQFGHWDQAEMSAGP